MKIGGNDSTVYIVPGSGNSFSTGDLTLTLDRLRDVIAAFDPPNVVDYCSSDWLHFCYQNNTTDLFTDDLSFKYPLGLPEFKHVGLTAKELECWE